MLWEVPALSNRACLHGAELGQLAFIAAASKRPGAHAFPQISKEHLVGPRLTVVLIGEFSDLAFRPIARLKLLNDSSHFFIRKNYWLAYLKA